jgi:signal transduction histidine kinase
MGIANVIDKCNDDQMAKEILFGQIKPIIEKLDRIIIDMNLLLNHTYQLDLGWENVELNTLLDDIKDIIDISKNDQILIKNDFKKVPMLYTIKGYIHSILFNLLSNAIKYKKSNQKAIISIKTHKAMGDKICLEIADNGIGIDLNLHGKKIFGFHKRFHNHVEGRGMGLHMTKTQIELMGGSIEVESKVMVGTKFKIYLPVNSSQIE